MLVGKKYQPQYKNNGETKVLQAYNMMALIQVSGFAIEDEILGYNGGISET